MAKIPFDIKFRPQIESGEYKVKTNFGSPVEIVCWDRRDDTANKAIVGIIRAGTVEEIASWNIGGRLCDATFPQNPDYDLFLVTPEPELSEWELAIAKYRPPTDSKETIQRIAAELLDLARKQLQPEIDAEIEKAYKNADEVMYRKGKEDGIVEARTSIIAFKIAKERAEEALTDLPRWKTIKKDDNAIVRIPHVSTNMLGERMLYIGENAISISCLMKLPGFKEDEK